MFSYHASSPPLDPCEDIDRQGDIVDDGSRSPYCKSDAQSLCDNSVSGWYRVLAADNSHKLSMPQFCPDYEHCGTESPIWLNGNFSMFHLSDVLIFTSFSVYCEIINIHIDNYLSI